MIGFGDNLGAEILEMVEVWKKEWGKNWFLMSDRVADSEVVVRKHENVYRNIRL